MEGEGWTSDDFVRDFDVDYTLLLENLMDPDHGLFAHQVTSSAMQHGLTARCEGLTAGCER